MSIDNAEFRPVTFKKEIDNILIELASKAVSLAGLSEDQHQFQFKIRHVADDVVYVEAIAPVGRALKPNEPLQILFGLPDGLYLVKTRVAEANLDQVSFQFGPEVFRLQRRNNFRTILPTSYKISYRLTGLKNQSVKAGSELALVDLSAGGMRVTWSAPELVGPAEGDAVAGILILPTGRQLELFGTVKTIIQGSNTSTQIGIEFQNLSVRDEQTLLFVCMQVRREQQPIKGN
jgi:c-di-GMP-binding flagellar brake protein YcgR